MAIPITKQNYDAVRGELASFFATHKGNVAVVTSGGTIVPLEKVRLVDVAELL